MATYIDALNGDHTDGRDQFQEYLENRPEREKLQDEFIHRIVEGMDYKDLVTYAHEMLSDYYSDMTDEELTEQVKQFHPDLLENQ